MVIISVKLHSGPAAHEEDCAWKQTITGSFLSDCRRGTDRKAFSHVEASGFCRVTVRTRINRLSGPHRLPMSHRECR